MARMEQGRLLPIQGSSRTEWSICILCLQTELITPHAWVAPHQHTQSSLSMWCICTGGEEPAQVTEDPSPKPPGSVGTSLGFRHLRFRAIVCLLLICKQSEHTVLTHLAALRMMKNLGVKSHVSLVERIACSGASSNFNQVLSVSAGLSPVVLPWKMQHSLEQSLELKGCTGVSNYC